MNYTFTLTDAEVQMIMSGLFEKSYYYYEKGRKKDCIPYDDLNRKINELYMKQKRENL